MDQYKLIQMKLIIYNYITYKQTGYVWVTLFLSNFGISVSFGSSKSPINKTGSILVFPCKDC